MENYHPYTEDFRNSIIQFTKVDLNWFFDQWLETEKRIDYGVTHKNNTVTFTRYGRCNANRFYSKANDGKFMIITFQIIGLLRKQMPPYLKMHAWDLLQPKYEVTLSIPSGIKEVKIDPTTD